MDSKYCNFSQNNTSNTIPKVGIEMEYYQNVCGKSKIQFYIYDCSKMVTYTNPFAF